MARTKPTHRPPSAYCKAEGCTRYPQRKGLCRTHGCPPRPPCRVQGCETGAVARGLCTRHDPRRGTCKAEGCTLMKQRRGYCRQHLGTRHECKAEGCIQFVDTSGQCPKHGRHLVKICSVCGVRRADGGGLCSRCGMSRNRAAEAKAKANDKAKDEDGCVSRVLARLVDEPNPLEADVGGHARTPVLAPRALEDSENELWRLLKAPRPQISPPYTK